MLAASPLQACSLFLFVTAAAPAGTIGRLSTTECTYLPTLIIMCSVLVVVLPLVWVLKTCLILLVQRQLDGDVLQDRLNWHMCGYFS